MLHSESRSTCCCETMHGWWNKSQQVLACRFLQLVKARGWSRFLFSGDFGSFPTHPIIFYRNLIVGAQNQQFSASPTYLFPYKQCKVLFSFSRLSQHWIFSVHATLGTLFQKKLHKLVIKISAVVPHIVVSAIGLF